MTQEPAKPERFTISLDVETAYIRRGVVAPELACCSMAFSDAPSGDPRVYHHADPLLRDALGDLLSSEVSDELVVGHNVAFDFSVLMAKWPELTRLIFEAYEADRVTDTMLREKLQHIALGVYWGYHAVGGDEEANGRPQWKALKYGLADVCKRRLKLDLDKSLQCSFEPLIPLPLAEWPPEAVKYSASDAQATLWLWRDQEGEGAELLADQYRQARAALWLQLCTCWGTVTDAPAVARFRDQVATERAELERELIRAGLVRETGSKNTAAAQVLMLKAMAALGKAPKMTPKGDKPTLDRVACEESGDPQLVQYARHTTLGYKLNREVPLLESGCAGLPIQPKFESLLETGRTSSSPNIQNLSTGLKAKAGEALVRECFVPRPGYVFAVGDYPQIELRCVAQVCLAVLGYSRLAEFLNTPNPARPAESFDPHLELSANILNIPYAEADARWEAMRARARLRAEPTAGDKEIKKVRQVAKVGNFGFLGGLGAAAFVSFAKKGYDITLTEPQAAELKRVWLATWPEFTEYFRWVGAQTDVDGATVEQLYVGRKRGDVSFTEAANTFFQGLAADLAKRAGWLISRACYVGPSPLFGSRIVNFVHDEFVLECPEAGAPEAAEELARLMVEGAKPFLPDLKLSVEPLLCRRWSKRAEALRGPDGRLVPWDSQ